MLLVGPVDGRKRGPFGFGFRRWHRLRHTIHPPSRTGWHGSHESLIVKSRSRRLLSIRLRNQAHPAARNTGKQHRVLRPLIRSSGLPAQTKVLANVLSGEKPPRSTPSGWPPKTSSLGIHNFVSGSTIRWPFGGAWAEALRRDGETRSCGSRTLERLWGVIS